MGKWVCWWMLIGCLGVLAACQEHSGRDVAYRQADSLNHLAYDLRYKDLDASERLAGQAYKQAAVFADLQAEALNNMAFCAFMRMDFERAARLYRQAAAEGTNEIEHLIADVGLMKICQRTSANKDFYDYRNSAWEKIRRIREDDLHISDPHERTRLHYGISEFHIVSGIYFYYLQQYDESLRSINAIDEASLKADTAQWLYYAYMRGSGGMYEAPTREKTVQGEFAYLVWCLQVSRLGGYVYFEANALQAMAELLDFGTNSRILEEEEGGALRLVNDKGLPADSLPPYCARKALALFKQYADWYQISGTYRTLATCYNRRGNPRKALACLDTALFYVNRHHETYYHCTDTLDRLVTYTTTGGKPTELKWIADEGIKTVPEWILRLREQLSRTYAAMGNKPGSDYNRNIYLDLLDYTRQDKALESRYAALEKDTMQLNVMLGLVVSGFLVLVVLFVLMNRRWKEKNRQHVSALKQVADLCRKITSSVPASAAGTEEVVEAVSQTVAQDFELLFGVARFHILLEAEESELPEAQVYLPLLPPGKDEKLGMLALSFLRPLRKEERSLLELVVPYLAWTLDNGLNLVSMDEERRRLEKEQYVHEQHLAENKRQNILKKACVAIVTGILPYIDRVANEVGKLKTALYARQAEVREGKLHYIGELINRINEYNDILALWIKMRQGALSLNIESFGLDELFGMIAKGRRSFEMKHQQFQVVRTQAVVKADKALTLFMINTLVENARKYTPQGGKISVRAEESEDYVEISVADNGPGLSAADVSRIIGGKVYDSGSIGMDTASDTDELKKQKGHGFGLMNCKGIIEKYRKTNSLFGVCKFDIDSEPGRGSRFYFRLPKGMKKVLTACLLLGAMGGIGSCSGRETEEAGQASRTGAAYDSLLAIADGYANQVYYSNVDGHYEHALLYADSALHCLNAHCLRYAGKSLPRLELYNEEYTLAEQAWMDSLFDTDYYILMDIRNEVAVAGLALNDFRLYYYNNKAYAMLYKQISKDRSLEQYCRQMQQSANNKTIALALFVLLVGVCLVGYYLLYWRHRLHYRYNLEQVFAINRAVFSVASPADDTDIAEVLLDKLFTEMNELMPVAGMALALSDGEAGKNLKYTFYRSEEEEGVCDQMNHCFHKRQVVWTDGMTWCFFPLLIELGSDTYCAGVLAMKPAQPRNREEDKLLVELVMSYLAVALYNVVVRVKQKQLDIELAQDDARKVLYEENMLHVQNMVLDNCLSTIKHETIYYPNRIKQIIDSLRPAGAVDEEEKTRLQTVDELVGYYKDVFTLLTSCAARQLDEVTFRRTEVSVGELMGQAAKYLEKHARKRGCALVLETGGDTSDTVWGDKVLLSFLLENLLDEALGYPCAGTLKLETCREERFVRFSFTDTRRNYTQEQLNELFYPSLERMRAGGGNGPAGTEYLVCKQIIREHDELAGSRGCRINACKASAGGFTVWFTVPWKQRI